MGQLVDMSKPVAGESQNEAVAATMQRVNRAWLEGQVEDLVPMVHPEIVMALPGSMERIRGREDFLAGFRDFCHNARICEFRDRDYQIDITGETAVVSFRYDMVYERSGEQYHSTAGTSGFSSTNEVNGLPCGAQCSMSKRSPSN